MSERDGGIDTIDTVALADIPAFEVKSPKKERRGAGIPLFPNFAALQGQGVGAHLLAIVGSKFGMIAVLGSLSVGAAAVGVTMRNDDLAKSRTNAKALTRNMKNASAASLAGQQAALQGGANSKDGMAYIAGGSAAEGGPGAQGGDGASASANVEGGAGADGGAGAKDGAGAEGVDGAKNAAGANPADAVAAALAGAAGQGAQAAAGARPQLAKMQGFGGSGGGGGGGGGGLPSQASLGGRTSQFRDGADASVRQAGIGKGGRERTVATGRRTAGINSSQSFDKLAKMAPNMNANRTGTESSQSAHQGAWDAAKPSGLSVSGPGAMAPSGGGSPATGAGLSVGEGGPVNTGGGGAGAGNVTNVPDIPAYKNITPYQWAIDIAKIIMLLIMVLAIFSAIAKKFGILGSSALIMIYNITAALGGILALLGVYMLAMGQYLQGAIWTILGGVTALIALKNADDTGKEAEHAAKETIKEPSQRSAELLKGGKDVTHTPADATKGVAESWKGANGDILTKNVVQPTPGGAPLPHGGVTPATPGSTAWNFQSSVGTQWTQSGAFGATAPTAGASNWAMVQSGFVPGLVSGGLAGVGFATADSATNHDAKGFKDTAKENYKKKYGIDPDTNQVINKKKFDEKYGEGAADRWNKAHQNLD